MTRCPWCARHWLVCAALTPGRRGRSTDLPIPSRSVGAPPTAAGFRFAGIAALTPATPGRRST